MYDMHFDLLTLLYYFYKNEISIDDIRKIYNKDNILGGIINLYFMPNDYMHERLNFEKKDYEDVVKMFTKSIKLLTDFENNLQIKPTFLYSIEGCDYINDIIELGKLKKLGLNIILPVWNYKNKYGSGVYSSGGLTKEGIKLIKYSIRNNIVIDLSHSNKETFYDILKIISKNSIVIASHSNCHKICGHVRNLDDDQLKKLNDNNGYISLVLYKTFISLDNDYEKKFIEHLNHIIYTINFNTDHIFISTDYMAFINENENNDLYNILDVKNKVEKLLLNYFDEEIINKILYLNPKEFFNKVKNNDLMKIN